MSREGGLPGDREGMRELGRIANAFGATCTQSFGGVPTNSSRSVDVHTLNKSKVRVLLYLQRDTSAISTWV